MSTCLGLALKEGTIAPTKVGLRAINAWCSIPSAVTAEMMSMNDFDSITIDMQHGLVDYQVALNIGDNDRV